MLPAITMKPFALRTLPALVLAAFSGLASAASFQQWGQNASGLGVAYAGSAAVADNASTNYFNPAGLTQLDGFQLSVGAVGLGSRYEFRDNGSTPAGGGNGGDAGAWSALPNLYISARLTEDLSAGFGISAPFKVATEYNNGWLGQVQALKTDISAVNYNPSLAYRLNDKVSIGLGVNYQRLKAELSSDAGLLGVNRFEGDDTAWGWNAGALFKLSPAMKVGIAYRSGLSYRLDGTRTLAGAPAPATANLKLPGTATLSVWQQVSDRWEAMGDLSYTRWRQANGMAVAHAVGSDLEDFNYKNAWRLAWGAAYKANDALKLKFGLAYERTPVQSPASQTARIPDADRLWLTLGGQWNAGRYGKFDLGYAYIHLKDAGISQVKGASTLNGEYDAAGHLLGMQYSVGF